MFKRLSELVLFLLTIGLVGRDILVSREAGIFDVYSMGEAWYGLNPGSLNLVQALVQRYLHEGIWDPVIATLLQGPLSVIPAIGLAIMMLGRRRRT